MAADLQDSQAYWGIEARKLYRSLHDSSRGKALAICKVSANCCNFHCSVHMHDGQNSTSKLANTLSRATTGPETASALDEAPVWLTPSMGPPDVTCSWSLNFGAHQHFISIHLETFGILQAELHTKGMHNPQLIAQATR